MDGCLRKWFSVLPRKTEFVSICVRLLWDPTEFPTEELRGIPVGLLKGIPLVLHSSDKYAA
jgi:hypothetical protein